MAPLKVIGASYSRCGTDSLRTALNILGYNCHHGRTMLESDHHAEGFTNAYENPGIPVDWDYLYEGFDVAVDTPTMIFIEPLLEKYPNAKIILITRDAESWYTSMFNLVFALRNSWPENMESYGNEVRHMFRTIVLDGALGDDRLFLDKEKMKGLYEAHNEHIKRIVPPERLLVLDLRDGVTWDKICPFLGEPIPVDCEYPHVNSTSAMLKECKSVMRPLDADIKSTEVE